MGSSMSPSCQLSGMRQYQGRIKRLLCSHSGTNTYFMTAALNFTSNETHANYSKRQGEGRIKKKKKMELYITFWPLKYSPPKRINSSFSGWAEREPFSLQKKEEWPKQKHKSPVKLAALTQPALALLPSGHKGLSIICQITRLWYSPQG